MIPRASEIREAPMNQANALRPMRPIVFEFSTRAMPTTSVESTVGQ